MSLMMTPGKLAQRAEFYYQLSALTKAGIGLLPALAEISRNPPGRAFVQPVTHLIHDLNQGATFSEALRRLGVWLPEFDIALLEAGEHSGRLDSCFQLLSNYYAQRAQMLRKLIGEMAYPAFLVHLAVLIAPGAVTALIVQGDGLGYLQRTLAPLIPLYATVFLLALACQGRHGERWRSWMETFTRFLPVLGKARHQVALARLSAALEALIGAGVTIVEAWELAAAASGSPALHRAVRTWKPQLQAGKTPAELVSRCPLFPSLFASLYFTAETSGDLDQTLQRLYRLYQDSASRKLQALVQWIPRVVYLIIAILIGMQIVSFYTGYFTTRTDGLL